VVGANEVVGERKITGKRLGASNGGVRHGRLALLCQFLRCQIIEVSLSQLKLTGQAQPCLGKRTGTASRPFFFLHRDAAGLAGSLSG
jgi:hypothetical protein